ncbi:MAG: alanine racemase [Candidatus Electrothrix sp. AR3]|nr:alanine racemase [Candidatus Electrothrix sp. AR3]
MVGCNGYSRCAVVESFNRVEISLSALCFNYALLKKRAPATAVLAMIKADGYGHGMVECAQALTSADCFGVAETVEGIRLRNNGITQPILVLTGILPEVIPALFLYRLTPVVVDTTWLPALSAEARRQEQEIKIHLKIDIGMGRQGCTPQDAAEIIAAINSLPGLVLAGVLAHFPKADQPESVSTPTIASAFCRVLDRLHSMLPQKNTVLHLANSGGTLYFPHTHHDMIRPGIALYGCYPDGIKGRKWAQKNGEREQLKPVMRFSSRVIQVRDIPTGTGLGYGHIFTTDRPTRIAIIPAGYDNGYLRSLSNKGLALIRGQRVPVVGRVSMNLTMFDITDIGEVCLGDEVVLLGCQGEEEISADEIAEWMGTINYEVLCLLGNLNDRVYLE